MLRAHSYLWHYLWVAPNVLLLALAIAMRQRRLHREFPIFSIFAVVGAFAQLTIYFADINPAVSPETWWRVYWVCLVVEGLLKFGVVAEIFDHAFHAYSAIARLGRFLIRGVGAALILTAAVAAAVAEPDGRFGIISGAHLLQQTIYLIETGLLIFIFAFSAYFKLRLERRVLGIALGLGISACVHLAAWAVVANAGLSNERRELFDFANMATYHVCVLIWFYYLLVPSKARAAATTPTTPTGPPVPENNLAVWNRELERLLQP